MVIIDSTSVETSNGNVPGFRVVIEPSPARTAAAAAGWSGIAPDLPVVVPLVDMAAGYSDFLSLIVVIKLQPAGAAVAAAGSAGITPDAPVVMQLNKLAAAGRDCCSLGVIVQLLPTGTTVAAAG